MINQSDDPITLSSQSVDLAVTICETVKHKNAKNATSVNMADGISAYVERNGFATPKQAVWLCRNADYWKISRPREMMNVIVKGKARPEPSVTPTAAPGSHVANRILTSLERIERMLKEHAVRLKIMTS